MQLVRRLSVLAAFIAAVSIVAPAAAQRATPPDVVRLRDGTFLRGTIVERSPARVVVMLATGETRSYPADQIESAGPDIAAEPASGPAPETVVVVPPEQPMARLHVRSTQEGLSLHHRVWLGAGDAFVSIDRFDLVCYPPCDVEVPEGIYELGIALRTAMPQAAGGRVELRGDMTLELGYDHRTPTRIAGALVLGVGVAAGTALVMGGIVVSPTYSPSWSEVGFPMIVSGSIIAGITTIVGLVFLCMSDAPSIEISADGVRF